MIEVGKQIIELIKKFKDGGLLNDLNIIYQILVLILGLTKSDKAAAGTYFYELKTAMTPQQGGIVTVSVAEPLEALKEKIKSQHETLFTAADLVR